ncbi:RNA pseudouridine synthase [Candidatus Poribacteria bacterium]|nr:RNA pseudouridine synthase [Candidatus Poribacteria bacterium]
MTSDADRPVTLDFVVSTEDEGRRLDVVLAGLLPERSRSQVQQHIREGRVLVNGRARRAGWRLSAGTRVVASIAPAAARRVEPEAIDLDIAHIDADVIVLRKPAGVVVHPTDTRTSGTLVNALLHHYPAIAGVGPDAERPGIVHRLDRDTTGLMMVARTQAAYVALQDQLRDRTATRVYGALVCGSPPDEGRVSAPIGRSTRDRTRYTVNGARPRDAATRFEVVERFGETFALLDVGLETGRTHQIRVHLSHIGHPVAGDPVYGGGARRAHREVAPELRRVFAAVPRQLLHARRLAFVHPGSGARVEFDDPLPDDMYRVIQALRQSRIAGAPSR